MWDVNTVVFVNIYERIFYLAVSNKGSGWSHSFFVTVNLYLVITRMRFMSVQPKIIIYIIIIYHI